MPIAEIIDEIDAYLSRLRLAREILVRTVTEAPQKRAPRGKRKYFRLADPGISGKRRAEEKKSRSNEPAAHPSKEKEHGEPAVQVSLAVPQQTSHQELSPIVEPRRAVQQSVAITRLPSSRRISSIRSGRNRAVKPASVTPADASKPAIALAGPAGTRIVVVSAEQVQREREQAARPVATRPRLPGSGLTGRRAFEALFKDGAGSSKAPAQ
jgi:hypothetical protein